MYYIAVDIGCIECGEGSEVLGVFTDEATAEVVCNDHRKRQSKDWTGQHAFEVFEVEELDRVYPVSYS